MVLEKSGKVGRGRGWDDSAPARSTPIPARRCQNVREGGDGACSNHSRTQNNRSALSPSPPTAPSEDGHGAVPHHRKESLSHTTSGGPPPRASGGGNVLSLAAYDGPLKRECPCALFWEGWQGVELRQQCDSTTTGTSALPPSSREIPTMRARENYRAGRHMHRLDNPAPAAAAPGAQGACAGMSGPTHCRQTHILSCTSRSPAISAREVRSQRRRTVEDRGKCRGGRGGGSWEARMHTRGTASKHSRPAL
jgi:hypothetical protein